MKKMSKSIFFDLFSSKKGQTQTTPGNKESSTIYGGVFGFFALCLWFLDTTQLFGGPYGGFNLNPTDFFQNWLSKFTFGNVWFDSFLVIMIIIGAVLWIRSWRAGEKINVYRFVTIGLFTLTIIFFVSNPGWIYNIKAVVHFLFILSFGFMYIRRVGSIDGAFLTIVALFVFDFFLFSTLLRLVPFLKYLSLLGTIVVVVTFSLTPNWFTMLLFILLVIFIIITTIGEGGPATGVIFSESESAVAPLTKVVEKVRKGVGEYKFQIEAGLKRQLESATGGYYEGKVEKNVAEPLGVYIEDIERAEKEFYEGEKIIVWATVKARTLDEEHPVNITLDCVADEDEKGEKGIDGSIIPAEKREFRIETLEEEDISCAFDEGLEKGSHEIKLTAEFDFTTMAYLKTYFMDKERRRALIRDGVDIFNEYGIKDKDPIAVYTNGPVKIGAETTKSLPLGVDKDAGMTMPRLGITLHNKWLGKIKEIKELHIEVPDSISIVDCDYNFSGPWRSSDEGFVIYKLKEGEKKKDRLRDIKEYRSINCRLKIDNPKELLGNTPISVRYYRIKADYIYKLEEPIIVTVFEPKGHKSVLINCEDECANKDGCVCPEECPIKREIERGENCTAIIQPLN